MDSFYTLSGGKMNSGFVKTYISVKEPKSKTTRTWKSEHPYSKEALEKAIKFEDGVRSTPSRRSQLAQQLKDGVGAKGKPKKKSQKKSTQSNTLHQYLKNGLRSTPSRRSQLAQQLKGGVVYGNSNEVQRTLQQYGDRTIIAMKVIRTPISGAINRLLNWITLGKMKKLKNKHGYNDFFHLALELNLGGGKKIYLEKNERVNLSSRFSTNKKTQTMEVNINGKPQKTVRELYETTLQKIGEYNFYQYRAFSLNCQKFIQDVLRTNGFLTPPLNQFIMQDVESIAKNVSGFTKRVANAATDVAGYFSKWFGRGLDDLPEDVRNALRKNQEKHKQNTERDFGQDFKEGWDLATKTVGRPIMKEIHSHTNDPVSGMYLEIFGGQCQCETKRSRVMKMASILRGKGISKKTALKQAWKMFAYD